MSLLSLEGVSVRIGDARPLEGISLCVARGEVLGIVGESGSGKSMTAMAVMGLLGIATGGHVSEGRILFDGIDLTSLPETEYRRLRGRRLALVTQNPMTSLDPVRTVGSQIDQVMRTHFRRGAPECRRRSIEIMERLRIPEAGVVHGQYPHQLSGGMRQRIVIAMALAGEPDLIIADEPTTALDVTVQAQIIQILVELVRRHSLGLVLITHDMGVVAQACDRVAVLYAGRLAELAPVERIFTDPVHPYTRALMECVATEDHARGTLVGIPGTIPGVSAYPSGCRFHPRCTLARPSCAARVPAPTAAGERIVACDIVEARP